MIVFERVRFQHGDRVVLRDVTFQVDRGETLALVGRSGAGKSTLLKLINRMLEPCDGRVLVEGRDTRAWHPTALRLQTGYVLQEVGLFPHMTVARNVGLVPGLAGWPRARIDERTNELLALVGLPPEEFAGRWPDELSGGQRQRVGVARALAADPPVVLMDEPFGSLDPITRAELHRSSGAYSGGFGRRSCSSLMTCAKHSRSPIASACSTRVSWSRAVHGRCSKHRPIRRCERSSSRPSTEMTSLFQFWSSHASELWALLGQHIGLVVVSTAAATAAGVPIGVIAARRPRFGVPLTAAASIVQTVPSLALLGFLLPLPFVGGVGVRTALAALILYGLLPVIRTTASGIRSIDPAILEAADAMGMTPRQRLLQVELPLALPSIIAGVRVSAVVGVGTVTIAAAIGAGGLGEYIYRGLSMIDATVILAGAVPVAVLAILVDGALLLAERALSARRRTRRAMRTMAAAAVAVCGVAVALMAAPGTERIVVGSKNFTEQVILGELMAQAIERYAGLPVDRRLNLGGTFICDRAIQTGDIDLYVEYSGTALTAVFKRPIQREPGR